MFQPPTRLEPVRKVLQDLPTKGLPSLKELFWSELGYERVNSSLPRRSWSGSEADCLAEDPLLLAAGGNGNDFRIIYSRLAADRLRREEERVVASRLLREHPYSLFVFSDTVQQHWHFVNVKNDRSSGNRMLFRRITVGPDERLRTAAEQLAKIDLERLPKTLFGLSPLDIQKLHDEAFDVEPVTREFFRVYAGVFHRVEKLISGFANDERKRLFTQRLFNRLMFIAFVQKKKWLRLSDTHANVDYLWELWNDYKLSQSHDDLFYRNRLELLFFAGLNNSQQRDILHINGGGVLKKLIGDVPYLNGGLFEKDEDEHDSDVFAPDDCIEAILTELFNRFNFTVSESTPSDIEVAVDPEMLGKVFEELVTGRHESGSYYTPKSLVSFMGREALKGYLRAKLPNESPVAIADFVDRHEPSDLRDPEAVLEALRNVRICDPACGSGAYLLGMLHELLDLRACLFNKSKNTLDPISTYKRKLEIIQNNLYGVDIDKFAVNIARLRLWLSLAVEYEGNDPPPLPNLKFKIEVGDSLAAPRPSGYSQQAFRDNLISRFREAKRRYMTAHSSERERLEKEIFELKQDIAVWTHGGNSVSGFDWAVEFAEVFAEGGFDIVLANPPYVRMELFKEKKPELRANFPEVHSDRADLYVYFYGRAIQLLRPGGMLVFISSNKWLRAKYGSNLRSHISHSCSVLSITDFGELPVFQSAATFPMIFVAQLGNSSVHTTHFTQVKSLNPPYPDVLALVQKEGLMLSRSALEGADWHLQEPSAVLRQQRMNSTSVSLEKYVNGRIFYGIKTGFNPAFVLNDEQRSELVALNPESASIIKPLIVGDDIRKWRIDQQSKWILYMYHGIDVSRLSGVLKHLSQFRTQLESRATRHYLQTITREG